MVREGRPIGEIFSADYTFLNQALAEHYGLETELPPGGKTVRVDGANEFERGGMMRLGAVLTATSAPLRTSPVKRGDWNEYHIVAKGWEMTHSVNGATMVEVIDEDEEMRRANGIIALQLHAGPPMKVQFKDIRIKVIK